MKQLGINKTIYYVDKGIEHFFGSNNFELKCNALYNTIDINNIVSKNELSNILKSHQKGETDFITFCNQVAKIGISYWVVDLIAMNIIYFDSQNNSILEELIPTI